MSLPRKIAAGGWMAFCLFVLPMSLALVTGCATAPSPASGRTPAQSVFILESAYAAALAIEVQYSQLPTCDALRVTSCKTAATLQRVRLADDAAWAAIQGAELVVRNNGDPVYALIAATNALQAFTTIVLTLQVKP